ncbi:MAG: acyl-CoA dehydrogenase family protein [Acidimicrobiia bacterium]|nr:acyl-CoA dehydrogenase family protein [Acidimicrobiia bacterium]
MPGWADTKVGVHPPGAHPVVDAARRLVPEVEAAAGWIEANRRLPDGLADQLTEAGLNHLYLPASVGGPEVDPLSAMTAIELLAAADGSAAWCAHVSSANSWQIATLGPGAVAAMAERAGRPPRRFSGSNRPCGTARPVEGGYMVSGQWDFASNCLHADWYCGACLTDDGGRRRTRAVFLPIADGTILDTWEVAGLRGTGSNDFVADEVFVPAERVSAGRHLAAQTGPLYHRRLSMVVNWALTAGVALGLGRGALDAFGQLATAGTAGAEEPLRERAPVQLAVGRAEARLRAARAFCRSSLAEVWEAAAAGADDDELDRLIPPARLAIVHALHEAVEVVNPLFHAGGTRSIFATHRLERCFRDAHVALQHGAGSPAHFEAGGRLTLGLPARSPLW